MHKAERAKEKAHMQDVMESVNDQFNDVRSLLRPREKKAGKFIIYYLCFFFYYYYFKLNIRFKRGRDG